MISSTRPRRTRSLLVLGLVLSIVAHLLGGALWDFFAHAVARITTPVNLASLRETLPPAVDIVRIERRPAPPAQPAHENRAPRISRHPQPVVTAAPAAPKHEIAHIVSHAPAQAPAVPVAARAPVQAPRRIRPVAFAPAPQRKPAYSDRQLAQLGATFAKVIAGSRRTLADVQADSERTPVVATVKHYAVAFSGIHEGMNAGDGEIFPISQQRIGNTMWYYTRYTYLHADGTYEADDIPWPFHYPIDDDPFARHDKRVPLQPPPDGYTPDRPLKPILAQFFGGPPVTD